MAGGGSGSPRRLLPGDDHGMPPTNDLFRVAESVSGGGDCLVYMVEVRPITRNTHETIALVQFWRVITHLSAQNGTRKPIQDSEVCGSSGLRQFCSPPASLLVFRFAPSPKPGPSCSRLQDCRRGPSTTTSWISATASASTLLWSPAPPPRPQGSTPCFSGTASPHRQRGQAAFLL